jgi:branched-chain amino acid transport system ATP-binding protein
MVRSQKFKSGEESRNLAMELLEVKNLTKRFGGLVAVNDVSFSVKEGELFGLIGPNGSGKTVLFNTISGIYKNDGGEVIFDNERITGLPPHEITAKGIGRTFQGGRIFPQRTVLENVIIGRHCRTRSHAADSVFMTPRSRHEVRESKEKALQLMEMIGWGLVESRKTVAKDLTFVMQSLLGIAIALATNPKILLLDEPIAGMNPSETIHTMELFERLQEELGITILIIEHHMKAIMGICRRIMVLNEGRKLTEGTPQEVSRNQEVIQAYLGKGYDVKGKQD